MYWEQSIKENQSFFNGPQIGLLDISDAKEPKVTSLDTILTVHQETSFRKSIESLAPKEGTKEFNLSEASFKEAQTEQEKLAHIIEAKNQELRKREEDNQQLKLQVQKVSQDFEDYKLFSEEQLRQKHLQLSSLQQMIEDQRAEMEKRQDQIVQLDTKVHDLSYEIKTLLYLHEDDTPSLALSTHKEEKTTYTIREQITDYKYSPINGDSSVDPSNETPVKFEFAQNLLKKCISSAQKLTGSNYYSNESSRYREYSTSYFAIDQRRLYDNLKSETGAIIIVYSQKENKLLFVNNVCKDILGWSPEKFVADFPSIIQEGMQDWKKALHTLSTLSESHVRLLMKTKNGQEILVNCQLGVIPTGLFRLNVIGVIYPT